MTAQPLTSLTAGERILVGGDRFVMVPPALADAFGPGRVAFDRDGNPVAAPHLATVRGGRFVALE